MQREEQLVERHAAILSRSAARDNLCQPPSGDGGISVWSSTCGSRRKASSSKHQDHSSPGWKRERISTWPVSLAWLVPYASGESSQQPTALRHSREHLRWSQGSLLSRDFSHPSTAGGSSMTGRDLPPCRPRLKRLENGLSHLLGADDRFGLFAPPARSAVRRPLSSAESTAASTCAASSLAPSPSRSSIATERSVAKGFAVPVPAMSGAEPWTGSKTPGPLSPRLADGSMPSDPVSIAAASLRMSPNMFSVTMTSKRLGRR